MARSAADSNSRRWSTLQDYGLHTVSGHPLFDEILRVAAQLCDTPIAALSFNDRTRERFVASLGCALDKIPLAKGFSDYVVSGNLPLVVNDVRNDTRFRHAALLDALPEVRFYAGVPIATADGEALGTLAVMDRSVRHLPDSKLQALATLGRQVMVLFDRDRAVATPSATTDYAAPEFHTVFTAMPGSHWLIEPRNLRVAAATDAALALVGQAREDVIGRAFADVLKDDEGLSEMITSLKRVKRTGRVDKLVAQRHTAPDEDGELAVRYWNVVNAPVCADNGELLYIVNHTVDVTELVQLKEREGKAVKDRRLLEGHAAKMEEDILRRSQEISRLNEHLHMAQAVANVGSWEYSVATSSWYWSDELHAILGIDAKRQGAAPDPVLAAVHPDDRQRLVESRERAIEQRAPLDIEHRIVLPDGAVRHVRQQARFASDEGSQSPVLFGTIQDITTQKEVEDELYTRAQQQAVVARFGQKALTGRDFEDLLDDAAELVAETLDVEYCKILQLQPDGKAMKLVAGTGWKEGLVGKAIVSIGRGSQAGLTLMSKHSVIVTDLRKDPRFTGPALLRNHGVVSGISVIIAGKDGPWGALGAHTTRLRNFTQDDVNFFESFANIIAEAAYRKRVIEEMGAREARVAALLRVARRALTNCGTHALWQYAAEQVAETLNVEYCKVAERLEDGSGMKVVAGAGWQEGVVGHTILATGKSSQGGYVLRASAPVTISDLPTETRFRPSPLLLDHGVDSGLCVAIPGAREPVGMLCAHTTQRRSFDAEEADFLAEVARLLAETRRPGAIPDAQPA